MAHFLIIALLSSVPVTYLYNDARRALAKATALARRSTPFEIRDAQTEATLTTADLEARIKPKP